MTWKNNNDKFNFTFLIFCTQQFTTNLILTNITCQKIPHRWRVLFMCTDSFVQKRSVSTIHCQAGKETESISTHFSLYWKKWTNFLVSIWYNLYQNNYSPKCWWILVDVNWATKRQAKYTPLFTSTEVKYNC